MSTRLLGLAFVLLSTALAHAQLSVVHSFFGLDGAWARGTLTMFDGTLYGQTSIGGVNNSGTIFSLTPDGVNEVSTMNWSYSFEAPLDSADSSETNTGDMPHHNAPVMYNGLLYGAALFGGNQDNVSPPSVGDPPGSPTYNKVGNGGIYSINPTDGTGYTMIKTFDGSGTDPVANDAANEHSPFALYTGSNPAYAGVAFGMSAKGGTSKKGTIYSVSLADPSTYQVLYSFSADTGDEPHGQLTTNSLGTQLLGFTRLGGTDNSGPTPVYPDDGVIFSFDLATSGYQVIHTFTGGTMDGATNAHGYLLREGTLVFGTTELGGLFGKGIVFSMNEDGSEFSILHSFGGVDDGSTPFGSLILVDGVLYGTTTQGGANDDGSIFSLSLDGLSYSLLASFDLAITGSLPEDSLTVNADHTILYGLTQNGGVNDPDGSNYYGTLFALPIPEPSTYLLILIAAIPLALLARRGKETFSC